MSDTPRVDFCRCTECATGDDQWCCQRCHDLAKITRTDDLSTPLEEGTTP